MTIERTRHLSPEIGYTSHVITFQGSIVRRSHFSCQMALQNLTNPEGDTTPPT